MIISGTHLNEHDVTALAGKLRECGFAELAGRLEATYWADLTLFRLSAEDRRALVGVLDDCPDGLRNLRASIPDQLADEWRVREGLSA